MSVPVVILPGSDESFYEALVLDPCVTIDRIASRLRRAVM
jgi:hypothetical protein